MDDIDRTAGDPPGISDTDGPRISLGRLGEMLGGKWVGEIQEGVHITGASTLITRIRSGQAYFIMDARHWSEEGRKVMRQFGMSHIELAQKAYAAGAAAVVASSPILGSPLPVLIVPNSRHALWQLGREVRTHYRKPVIAITGSAGKSTTKEMVRHVLAQTHEVHSSPRNWNTVDGVALTLSDLLEPSDLTVLEVAISGLARTGLESTAYSISPDIAVITAIGEAHSQVEDSLEGTAILKARLFKGLSKDGVAILNLDTQCSDVLLSAAKSSAARIVTYGAHKEADVRLESYVAESSELQVSLMGRRLTFSLGVTGEHNARNALAVLAILATLGEDPEKYLVKFQTFSALKGRGAVATVSVGQRRVTVVDQSYNANPLSMEATIADFRSQFSRSRRLLLLGDMLELGESAPELHAGLLEAVVGAEPSKVFLVGPLMLHLWNRLPDDLRGAHLSTQGQARLLLRQELKDGDALFVKSSHGTGLHRVVTSLRESSTPVGPMRSWRAVVSGPKVQGVGYRNWLVQLGLRKGVNGWVRNRSDGKVEALIRGREAVVGQVLTEMRFGPSPSDVNRVLFWKVATVPRVGFRVREDRLMEDLP